MNKDQPFLLHHIFENQVQKSPNALAVKYEGTQYSYQEIDNKANQLAHYLISKGTKAGDLIGIYFTRSQLPIVAMLGILKAGAAYIPLDRTFPKDRINHIIQDTKSSLIITEKVSISELSEKTETPLLDISGADISNMPTDSFYEAQVLTTENDLCYIIYTSGSTGKPKGVMTCHFNVIHFINSFKQVCRLSAQDRLYNGFAYSFDGSVEEIWMAFSSGASLIVASDDTTKLASEAALLINKEKITFFSTVPTFLNMINEPLDNLKLIILSGEVCPPEIINKWASDKLRLLNVYGPTETTVNTSFWESKKGEAVTIGKPIPDYPIYILNADRLPVKEGEKGELYIGGKGLAKGYLNLEKQTNESFIENVLDNERLYKTGDLVSLNEDGNLFFHGRIDSQVKVRGYRIELSEIELVLASISNISNAVVTVTNHNNMPELAAYITLENKNISFDQDFILTTLKEQLPVYMIPSYMEVLAEMPRLTSGKIDRKQLLQPETPLIANNRNIIAPANEMENLIVGVWKEVFGLEAISIDDNFFNDLGGHSLLAAKATAMVREKLLLNLAIKDIYVYPTIQSLALLLAKNTSEIDAENTDQQQSIQKPKRSWVMTLAQSLSMYPLFAIMASPILLLMYFATLQFTQKISLHTEIMIAVLAALLIYPILLGFGILMKWLLIGKIKPGIYSLNSLYYYRWWLVDRIQAIANPMLLSGSPLMVVYFRLMGAKVGKNCIIDTHLGSAWDLLVIGDCTTIANETQIRGVTVEHGFLKIGHITIGKNCFIGIHSYLGLNAKMENHSKLGDISALQEGEILAKRTSKQGSPPIIAEVATPIGKSYKSSPFLWGTIHVLALVFIILFILSTSVPSLLVVLFAIVTDSIFVKILLMLSSGPLFVLSFCLFTALIKWLIFSKVDAGVYKTESFFYIRKWFIDNLMRLSVILIKPVYTTIFFPKWMRLLGAKVGRNSEISTVSQFSPELMTIGDESFFADGSIIGGRKFSNGYVELSKTSIGKRSFVGNSAILPVGTSLGNNCLLGVLSVPPIVSGTIPDHTDWLGSPSFNLPKRQIVKGFSDEVLFKPTIKLYILRYLIDSLRIFIPSTLQLFGVLTLLSVIFWVYNSFGALTVLLVFPLIRGLIAIINSLLTIAVKWILLRKIKPIISPLWSTFVWFNEAINGTYESIMVAELLPFMGTPFYAVFLRLMGCKIGKNVYMGTTHFSEFDLVHIEDNVELNSGAIIQNHLFEDRIMKASILTIKQNCTIGDMAVVLYDSVINEHTTINPLSLVMKNEILPSHTKWTGIPCAKVYTKSYSPKYMQTLNVMTV